MEPDILVITICGMLTCLKEKKVRVAQQDARDLGPSPTQAGGHHVVRPILVFSVLHPQELSCPTHGIAPSPVKADGNPIRFELLHFLLGYIYIYIISAYVHA